MKFTEEQLNYIEKNFKQTKNDKLIENVSKLKSFIPKNISSEYKDLDDEDTTALVWNVQINESEEKKFVCVCGRKIKRQYLLKHKFKDIVLKLGSGHYKEYCGISVTKVKKIVEAENAYNRQIEILQEQLNKGEFYRQKYLLDIAELPEKLRNQLSVGLPLTPQQMNYVNNKINSNITKSINNFSNRDITELNTMSIEDRNGLFVVLKNGRIVKSLDEVKTIKYQEIKDRDLINRNKTETSKMYTKSQIKTSLSEDAIDKARKTLEKRNLTSSARESNITSIGLNSDINSYKKNGMNIIQNILKKNGRKSTLKNEVYSGSKWWYLYDETQKFRIEYIDKRYDLIELKRMIKAVSKISSTIEWIIDKELFDRENCRNDIKNHLMAISKRYPEVLVLDHAKGKVIKKRFDLDLYETK